MCGKDPAEGIILQALATVEHDDGAPEGLRVGAVVLLEEIGGQPHLVDGIAPRGREGRRAATDAVEVGYVFFQLVQGSNVMPMKMPLAQMRWTVPVHPSEVPWELMKTTS